MKIGILNGSEADRGRKEIAKFWDRGAVTSAVANMRG